jgi:S-methylmethionine-dependent homocysteine/selenocysteine methylase
MSKYRDKLPQLESSELFLTDGGTETDLIYSKGFELPCFASFHLLNQADGYQAIKDYYRQFARMARDREVGFILCSLTYRASSDWGQELGYTNMELAYMNHKATSLLRDVAEEFETEASKMVISGCVGPREDAYLPNGSMTPDQAEDYHSVQINTLAEAGVDMITALTLNEVDEAIGITRAALSAGLPVVIAISLETDGTLLAGGSLEDAIQQIDAATDNGPAYYMINCAHPTHFDKLLQEQPWVRRIRGIRANASSKSHADLWKSDRLEDGNPIELGQQYADLTRRFSHINVLGGCCGTDHRHVAEICNHVLPQRRD